MAACMHTLRNGATLLDFRRFSCNTLFYGMARHCERETWQKAAAEGTPMPGGVFGAAVEPVRAARHSGAGAHRSGRECRPKRGRFVIGAFASGSSHLPLFHANGHEARNVCLLPSAHCQRKGAGCLPGAVRHGSARRSCRRRVLAGRGSRRGDKLADGRGHAKSYTRPQSASSLWFPGPAHASALSSVISSPYALARGIALS